MYTAVMIFQLIEKEQLHLEDNSAIWFNVSHFEKVTIADLLTHTSGIPEYLAENITINFETFLELSVPQYEPGEYWSYSNTNYALLAKIIENVSGLSYEMYLKRYICELLNLTNTTTQPTPQWQAHGQTYDYDKKQYRKITDDPYLHEFDKYNETYGDGGIYATVGEVAKFLKAFLHGQYTSKQYVQLILTPTEAAEHYSYGFLLEDHWIGHTGGWVGCSAQAFINIVTEDVIVLATNQEVFPKYEQNIIDYLMGKHVVVETQKHLKILPLINSDNITGRYELVDGLSTSFTIEKDIQFMIKFDHQLSIPLFKTAKSYYWIRNTMSYIDFANQLFIDEGIEIPYQKID